MKFLSSLGVPLKSFGRLRTRVSRVLFMYRADGSYQSAMHFGDVYGLCFVARLVVMTKSTFSLNLHQWRHCKFLDVTFDTICEVAQS